MINACVDLCQKICDAVDKRPVVDVLGNALPPIPDFPKSGYQIRLAIPTGVAGAVLGKGGENIKQLSAVSACNISLLEGGDPFNIKERIMVLRCASVPTLLKGVEMTIAFLIGESSLFVYHNQKLSYPNVPSAATSLPSQVPMHLQPRPMVPGVPMPPGGGVPHPHALMQQQQAAMMQRAQLQAAQTAQQYQYAHPPMAAYAQQYQQQQQAYAQQYQQHQQQQQQQQQHAMMQATPNLAVTQALDSMAQALGMSPPTYASVGTNIKMEVGIPDNIVGAILGKGGIVIKEIMAYTATVIHVSPKGPDGPAHGTLRIVQISGPQLNVQQAYSSVVEKVYATATGKRAK